ncbi:hypothetical protein BDI4_630036 [Burkholderia diffusa]|uniref:hypothetical protein n=1 Tax=Burkholderia diffusa TaxID=488732 RepID=UPI001CB34202|nr:hypothetical protein [Burkholderia diffusa]CAG9260391.1 hypothetical protein BDI4_630036 [Burkholderia diffusa]
MDASARYRAFGALTVSPQFSGEALTNLLPVFGETGLLWIGGSGFLLGFMMMVRYGPAAALS